MKKDRVAGIPSLLTAILLVTILPVAACGGGSVGSVNPTPTPSGPSLTGSVHAGQTAVSGATIQLYAAGSTGYGAVATALLVSPATSDASGKFSFHYTCPSASGLIYLVAVGGNPGLSAGTNNAALAMMAALGPCGSLASSATVSVNELTTGASVFALAQFMSPGANVGTSSTNTQGLANAFAMINNLVNVGTGTAPGPSLPAGAASPTATLNTIANILNSCTGSPGACSPLFFAATPSGATVPANTIDAVLAIALNPSLNPGALYGLTPARPPFQPALAQAPDDWMLSINYTGGGLHGPSALAIDQRGNVWIADYYGAVTEFSSQGQALSPTAGFTGGGLNECYGLTIDNSGNVWVTNEQSSGSVNGGLGSLTELSSSGQILSGAGGFFGGGINFPVAAASDADGNIWISNYGSSSASLFANSGAAISGSNGYGSGQLDFPVAVAVDGSGNAWLANQSSTTITKITADGTQATSFSCCNAPSGLAIDQHGNIWVTNFLEDSVSELSPTGVVLSSGFTGGGLLRPQAIAVDGKDNVWVANYHGDSITELEGADSVTPGTPLSPGSGYGLSAGLSLPFSVTVDGSGNVWVSSFANNTVSEFLGAAAPVKTPLLGPATQP
jgi:streptogramin lyase